EAVVNPAIAPVLVVDRSANPVSTVTQGFATPTEVEEDSSAISYAWRTVSNDGVAKGTFDQYAARAAFGVARTFDGLGSGEHSITIRVLGRARGRATDTQVVVDAFRAGSTLVSNPDLDA